MMTFLFRIFSALLISILSSQLAVAASTGWFETEGAKLRFVSDTKSDENGIVKAVVEIKLEPGWKTYWREPGDAGIPPHMDFSQSQNLLEANVHFPVPTMIDDGYGRFAGYKNSVSFPIDLKTNGKGLHVKSDIFIGVCNDICVPFSANVDLDLSQLETAPSDLEHIELARYSLPQEQNDDFRLKDFNLDLGSKAVLLDIKMPNFYPKSLKPVVFLHAPDTFSISQPELIGIEDGIAKFKSDIFGNPDQSDVSAGSIYAVLKLGQRSAETSINLQYQK